MVIRYIVHYIAIIISCTPRTHTCRVPPTFVSSAPVWHRAQSRFSHIFADSFSDWVVGWLIH